ncbi:MAG: site-specific DNA-methyltransferase [Pseudonocardiaceae bacterium]|nr:site-specific DNA-methyltransferase [Pseudonocardiaceae bacterium]
MPTTHPHAEVLHADALTALPTLTPESVDCVLTDPPYNSGGRTPTERARQSTRGKYVSGSARHTLADFAGDNRDQRSYSYWLALVLAECLRACVPGGSCLVFSDWRQLPATSDALQAAGWTWRGIIVWRKPLNRPLRNGFRRECEYVLWGSSGPLADRDQPVYLPGLLTGSQPRAGRRHVTEKPVNVMAELVEICPPGGTILDPFTGSGTTGVAAVHAGRSFLGIEVTDHYAEIANARVLHAMQQAPAGNTA